MQARADCEIILSCEPTLLVRWLVHRVDDLHAALGSGRQLRMVSARPGDVSDPAEVDLAIIRTEAGAAMPTGALVAPFLDELIGPVCRPDLVQTLSRSGPVEGVILHAAPHPEA